MFGININHLTILKLVKLTKTKDKNMKKMLLTTALVGSLVSGISAANAETKVSGNLAIAYYAMGNEGTVSSTSKPYNGFGTESQINISNSGTLSNGMKYAAGFSWEIDGGETLGGGGGTAASSKASTEGTYIEFINGGTTIGVGADRIANLDGTGSNFVGFGYRQISGAWTSITNSSYGDAYSQFGVYGSQKFDGGTIALVYTPNNGAGNLTTDDIGFSASKATVDAGPSAFTVGFNGDLGVKGLGVKLGYVSSGKTLATGKDDTANVMALSYQMGATKVGINRGVLTVGSTSEDKTTMEYGIAQTLSDAASIGLAYTVSDSNLKSSKPKDEKIWTASVGYNLGPVALTVQYKTATDIGGVAAQDATQLGLYLGTKF
jgi:hypothetical protein